MNDQRSVTDQMRDLLELATERGWYDAADWVNRSFPWPDETPPSQPLPPGHEESSIGVVNPNRLTGQPATIPAAGGLLWPHGERIEP